MNNYFLGLLKALLTISILDYIYLKSSSNIFYKLISSIQTSPLKLRIYPTIIVYILIFLMWIVFIYNQKDKFTFKENIFRAFLLGMCTYGIYDFTNMAIFKDWTINVALMDTIWGGVLYSLTTLIATI
jgi:uncharacterized membrane protein